MFFLSLAVLISFVLSLHCLDQSRVAGEVRTHFSREAVVVQCGADALAGDPLGSFNLTLKGVGECVEAVLLWHLPTLLLGGGNSVHLALNKHFFYLK